MVTRRPTLGTRRFIEVYREMTSTRRLWFRDDQFFKLTALWSDMTEGDENWKINKVKASDGSDFARTASVVALDDRVILNVDERLWELAEDGCLFSNFMLAHEMSHVALDHHARGAVAKHFRLYSGPNGAANLPPTVEELEANYAAAFLACGPAILNWRIDDLDLARRAYSDPHYVRKVRRLLRTEVAQREMLRQSKPRTRVIL